MKIIWAVNVPVAGTAIDLEATDKKRKELGRELPFSEWIRKPVIRSADFSFELCECCGSQIVGGRAKRGWRSCSPACNKKIGGAWAAHTLKIERELAGKRPMFFWWKIREECFRRDGFTCQDCRKVGEWIEYGDERWLRGDQDFEAHHIKPICEGGNNQLSNLVTLCGDCHKKRHSKAGKTAKLHKTLDNF